MSETVRRGTVPIPGFFCYPSELPIVQKKAEVIRTLHSHRVLIVAGATGSGKSTQLPKICMEAGVRRRGLIGCTQPRRIAAISLARRVSEELGMVGSHLVGYKVRFQDRIGPKTIIKFMTDGILLTEAHRDPLFSSYDVIIVDEAHERTLNIDFIIGMLKKVLEARYDLRIIISSATIDPEKFSKAFDNAPVIYIPSRTYPVEVQYEPIIEIEDDEIITYVDAAVESVEKLVRKGVRGDMLVFMPTERDIRETVKRLKERSFYNTEIYPLYARMASWQQNRIFSPTPHRKIIVATNVAETSLTIPNIECVIDTGLARISQYSPRTGTQGLPILKISRASAEQRKGRCGRTGPGICVRLFDEEDFLERPEFTPPEIKRSNLADVILRMLYLGLGDVEDFPFLDPPPKSAVKEGYAVLKELGAIYETTVDGEKKRYLTSIGKKMARLPLDPRLGRILLEAERRKALRDVLIIVSALSIQDPRERPFGEEEAADAAHAVFLDPKSDFLTLLNIWKAYQQEVESRASRSHMRSWCREHFLSFRRMQEWIAVHDEIKNILYEEKLVRIKNVQADYEAIHCSILSGFLWRVAMHEERERYRGVAGRELYLFPGTSIRGTPKWIVAAEVVETSRTFARMAAQIEPEWIEHVGRHLCTRTYFEPRWVPEKGNVMAFERILLGNLPIIEQRPIVYGKVNPEEARKIFIREALVDGKLKYQFNFMQYNRQIIKEVQEAEEKIRRRGLLVDDEKMCEFYEARIPKGIWSLRTFEKFLRDRDKEDLLKMSRHDVLREIISDDVQGLFPGHIKVGDLEIQLKYRFSPGSEKDGVTAIIPVTRLPLLPSEPFEWLVPGYVEEKVAQLLKGLPRDIRRRLIPLARTIKKVMEYLPYGVGNFWNALSEAVYRVSGVKIPAEEWKSVEIPLYLHFSFEIVDDTGKVIAAGRNLDELRCTAPPIYEDSTWKLAKMRWERECIEGFPEDIPEQIEVGVDSMGHIRLAYPGLVEEEGRVWVRLFPSRADAMKASETGIIALIMQVLSSQIKKLSRHWMLSEKLLGVVSFMGTARSFQEAFILFFLRDVFGVYGPQRFDMSGLRRQVTDITPKLALLGMERFEKVRSVVREREAVRRKIEQYRQKHQGQIPAVRERMDCLMVELEELVPPDFLERYRYEDMEKILRSLKALGIRIDRAYTSPEKDLEKEKVIQPFREELLKLGEQFNKRPDDMVLRSYMEKFQWMIEDYKIQVYAPEIRPSEKISAKILKEFLEKRPI